VPPLKSATSELLDVVNLVTQVLWADMRRSRGAIEPSQWMTLRHIARGSCTMSELARYKAVSLPTMSKSVEMLVRRGWVERVADTADRRRTQVQLTSAGRRVLAGARRRVEELLEARLASLTPAEREQLATSLQRVREALGAEELAGRK
jgi:DNA-binding MarR family transcriptional regulator